LSKEEIEDAEDRSSHTICSQSNDSNSTATTDTKDLLCLLPLERGSGDPPQSQEEIEAEGFLENKASHKPHLPLSHTFTQSNNFFADDFSPTNNNNNNITTGSPNSNSPCSISAKHKLDSSSPPAKLLRAITSIEMLTGPPGVDGGEKTEKEKEKVTTFVSQLKSGELQSVTHSDFRLRRLTYSHGTTSEDGTISPKKREKKSPHRRQTTIFASSEIGVTHMEALPFPEDVMGTYSCHGIEPSDNYNDEDRVHAKINQDRGCIVYPYNSSKDEALFMVLDGHGVQGDLVSEFVMRQVGFLFFYI
jgi:hypothetical protein